MAPKAVDARNRFNRDLRFRGHGPLLQRTWPNSTGVAHHGGMFKGSHGFSRYPVNVLM